MPSQQTQHIVSDHLSDRLPYIKPNTKTSVPSHAFGQRGIPKLVEEIGSSSSNEDDAVLRLNACKEILPLLSCQENKSQAVSAGLVEICTKLCCSHHKDAIVIAASNVLTTLFRDFNAQTCPKTLCSAVTNLVSCIDGTSNKNVSAAAAAALKSISSFRFARGVLDSNPEVLKSVITTSLQNSNIRILSNITKSAIGSQVTVTNGLVQKLKEKLSSKKQKSVVISCFNNIALHDCGVQEAINDDANVVSFLIKELLKKDSETTMVNTITSALMAYSTHKKVKLQLSESINDIAPALVSLLANENIVKSNIVTIIQNACDNIPKDIKTYTSLMIDAENPSMVTSVFHSRSCEALKQLLVERSCKYIILHILWKLSGTESGIKAITTDCLYFIDELVSLLCQNVKNISTSTLIENVLKKIAASSDVNANRVSKSLEKIAAHQLDANDYSSITKNILQQ